VLIEIVQALGFVVCIAGALSLNESFGVVAANRGVKSRGMYRFMRHPIYAGYFLEAGAFLAQNLSIDNILIMMIWACFQFRRIFVEEAFLAADPDYVAYQKSVPWRLIPFVW
jgi:protein-S-isoprenylcysteine O-methyltransferase Ste14